MKDYDEMTLRALAARMQGMWDNIQRALLELEERITELEEQYDRT